MFFDDLCQNLNPRSGVIQPYNVHNEKENLIIFDITWKGDFHFIVSEGNYCGNFYVSRNNERISAYHYFKRNDDMLFYNMQKVIDEIENGKYKNKKTLSERIRIVVKNRNLTSYMNNTKWNAFTEAIKEQMYNIPIKYKTLFDDDDPKIYWTIGGDEYFDYMNMASIEWFKIGCVIEEVKDRGRLLEPDITSYDKTDEILQIFHKFNIPYEYDKRENAFIIYGYK